MQPIRPAKGMVKSIVNVPKKTAKSLRSSLCRSIIGTAKGSIVLRVGGSYLFGVYFLENV